MKAVSSLVIVFFVTLVAQAQPDPNYVISVGSAAGFQDDTLAIPVFLEFPNGNDVANFSFGVCSDPNLVSIDCSGGSPNDCLNNGIIVPGTAVAMANNGVGPDLFLPAAISTGWTIACSIDMAGNDSLPAQDAAETVVTRYRLTGPGGSPVPLSVCPLAIGGPTLLVRLALVGGQEVVPETRDGLITILGASPDPTYTLGVSSTEGFTGDIVDVNVFLDFENGEAVAAASFGVCSNPSLLEIACTGGSGLPNDCVDNGIIVPGAALAVTNGGSGPDFFEPETTQGVLAGFTCAFVVHQTGADNLPPQNGAELVVTKYQLVGSPGSVAPLTVCGTGDPLEAPTLTLVGGGVVVPASMDGSVETLVPSAPFRRGDCNGDGFISVADPIFLQQSLALGGPAPDCLSACDINDDDSVNFNDPMLHFTAMFGGCYLPGALDPPFPDCGSDPTPDLLTCLMYDCTPPVPLVPELEYHLRLSDASGPAGSVVTISSLLDLEAGPGIQGWSFGVCHDPDLLRIQSVSDMGVGLIFSVQQILPDGWTTGVVRGSAPLLPGLELELHVAEYLVISDAPAELTYCDTLNLAPSLGTLPVPIHLVEEGQALLPATSPGRINGPQPDQFRRGDADADGTFNGLADGLFLLNFQFVPGSPLPLCMEAADVDDDGDLNGLADALAALRYQFVSGSPPPPPPGPSQCGPDPTADTLNCIDYPNCP